MSSKKSRSSWVLVLVAVNLLWTTACTKFLDEKREKPQTIEMSNVRFGCLQALPEEITKFLHGTVKDKDIHSGFECTKDALLYFKDKTTGTYADAYSMEDLRNFFGKYFLKKNNVSSEFGRELFKLKQVLLGGSDKNITKAEIQRLIEILDVIRDQAIKIAPYVPTLLAEAKNPTWEQVDKAAAQLGDSTWQLFKKINIANSTYTFDDLKEFMNGLDKFINASDTFFLTQKLNSNLDFVELIKNVLIGDKNNLDDLQNWSVAVKTVTGLYREALRYVYFIKGQESNGRTAQRALVLVARDTLNLLETSLPIENQGLISFAAIDTLLDAVGERGMIPQGISAHALKVTYKKIILRMLDPHRRGDARGLQGLERSHIVALKFELKIFELHQQFINGLKFDRQDSIGLGELKASARTFNPAVAIAKNYSRETLEQEALKQAWSEGMELLHRPHPVFYNREGRQVLMTEPESVRQNWGSLTRWNVMRALSRALLLGYGKTHNSSVGNEQMVEAGLDQWYKDFHQIGVELKAFDPRSKNSGARSFSEANFFTYSGNGDNIMDAYETFDFVSLLISGGMQTSEALRQSMVAKSCGLKKTDVFGFPWLSEPCFKHYFRQNFSNYFNNIPGMVLETAVMGDRQWDDFYTNLMVASRVSPAVGREVEAADLRTAVMILHYVESLMTVYDRNHDGLLDVQELRAASPRFLGFMKSVSPVKANYVVSDFFLFLVYKGKKPTKWEYTKFQAEKAFGSLGKVGRDRILQVLKVLKEEADKK